MTDTGGGKFLNIDVKRGYIYMCDCGCGVDSEQGGTRPVLVVKNQKGIDNGSVVTIIPITSKINKGKNIPTHVAIGTECGLLMDSNLQIEQIKTISKNRLLFDGKIREIGKVPEYVLEKVQTAIMKDLGFEELYFNEKHAFHIVKSFDEIKNDGKAPMARKFILTELKNYCDKYNKDYREIYKYYAQIIRNRHNNITNTNYMAM